MELGTRKKHEIHRHEIGCKFHHPPLSPNAVLRFSPLDGPLVTWKRFGNKGIQRTHHGLNFRREGGYPGLHHPGIVCREGRIPPHPSGFFPVHAFHPMPSFPVHQDETPARETVRHQNRIITA